MNTLHRYLLSMTLLGGMALIPFVLSADDAGAVTPANSGEVADHGGGHGGRGGDFRGGDFHGGDWHGHDWDRNVYGTGFGVGVGINPINVDYSTDPYYDNYYYQYPYYNTYYNGRSYYRVR